MIPCDCDPVHHRTVEGGWIHDRDEAAIIYVHGPADHLVAPQGIYGPFTPREVEHLMSQEA